MVEERFVAFPTGTPVAPVWRRGGSAAIIVAQGPIPRLLLRLAVRPKVSAALLYRPVPLKTDR
jgi:hypothetical protein